MAKTCLGPVYNGNPLYLLLQSVDIANSTSFVIHLGHSCNPEVQAFFTLRSIIRDRLVNCQPRCLQGHTRLIHCPTVFPITLTLRTRKSLITLRTQRTRLLAHQASILRVVSIGGNLGTFQGCKKPRLTASKKKKRPTGPHGDHGAIA